MPSALEITFLVISVVLVIVVFLTKSKAHEGDHRIHRRRDRRKPRE